MNCSICDCDLTALEIVSWEECEAAAMVLPGNRICGDCSVAKIDEEEE